MSNPVCQGYYDMPHSKRAPCNLIKDYRMNKDHANTFRNPH